MNNLYPQTTINLQTALRMINAVEIPCKLNKEGMITLSKGMPMTVIHEQEGGGYLLGDVVVAIAQTSFALGRKDGIKYLQGEMKKSLGL